MMPSQDGRALTEEEVHKIQHDVFNGFYDDHAIAKLFETIYLQRKILKALFDLFHSEPLRRVSTADPIRNSDLAHFKAIVAMEDEA